jgi:hypothetical protein
MANTLSKLTTAGNYYTLGTIDEATFNPIQTVYRKNIDQYSQQFNVPSWGLVNSTLTTNAIIAPDGTLTATKLQETAGSASTFYGVAQNPSFFIPGQTYTMSVYAKAGERNALTLNVSGSNGYTQFNLITGTVQLQLGGNASIVSVGNGWYRCSTTFKTLNTGSNLLYHVIIINNSGADQYVGTPGYGIYIWGAQLEIGSSPTIYEPTGANAIPSSNALSKLDSAGNYYTGGTIDEVTFNPNQNEYRKNLLQWSTTFSSSNYGRASATLINNANTAPDGTFTASKLLDDNTNARHGLQYFISQSAGTIAGATYTASIYAKAAENNFVQLVFGMAPYPYVRGGAIVDLTTGAITNYFSNAPQYYNFSTVYIKDGWWRVIVTIKIDNVTTSDYFEVNTLNSSANGTGYIGNTTPSGTYIWGPQLELGNQATIYEPTVVNAIPSSNTLSKLDNSGNHYLSGTYDEFTRGENLVTDGLIYYFDPAKTESWNGNTRVYDITGTQSPGTMVGNYTYSTDGGGTITLDAKTGYVDTGIRGNNSQLTSNSEFTMSVWVKFTGKNLTLPMTSYASGTVFGCFNYDGFGIDWLNQGANPTMYPRSVRGVIRIGGVATFGTTDYLINLNNDLNKWINFVWVYSSLNLANTNMLYVNTVASGPNTSASNTSYNVIGGSGDKIQIGGLAISQGVNPGAGTLPGSIGQALIYNRALSTTEIIENFNEMRSQYGV